MTFVGFPAIGPILEFNHTSIEGLGKMIYYINFALAGLLTGQFLRCCSLLTLGGIYVQLTVQACPTILV